MKMALDIDRSFTAERVAAQHCEELTMRAASPEERAEQASYWCSAIAEYVAGETGQLIQAAPLRVTVEGPQTVSGARALEQIGLGGVNCLLRCGGEDRTAVFSVETGQAIALTDLSFGGIGTTPESLPERMPHSAMLLVEQIAGQFAQAAAHSSGDSDEQGGQVVLRSENAKRIAPFGKTDQVAVFILAISASQDRIWRATIAMPEALSDILIQAAMGSTASADKQKCDTSKSAFTAIPFSLTAALAEFELTVDRLKQLAPGDEIPLAIGRNVPLFVNDLPFANGTIGSSGDRFALQLKSIKGIGGDHERP